jgi:hypothetical protein
MKSGLYLVIAAGNEVETAVHDFLGRHGLRIEGIPLGGDVFKQADPATPMFLNAWRVQCDAPDGAILYRRFGEPVIAFAPVGKGGLLLVGDSLFFTDGNLEEEKDSRPANINFLRVLLKRLSEGRFEEITPQIVQEESAPAPKAEGDGT